MKKIKENTVSLSVRELVEFVLNSGDIDNRRGKSAADSMQVGAAAHRKIQKARGADYRAEVPLKIEVWLKKEEGLIEIAEAEEDSIREQVATTDAAVVYPAEIRLVIDGRADGIIDNIPTIEEIKGVYRDIHKMENAEKVHLAQAEVYAFVYAYERRLPEIRIQMTYVQLENERHRKNREDDIRTFEYFYTFAEIKEKFCAYVEAYKKWAFFVVEHRILRNATSCGFQFPYEYRPGQRIITHQTYKNLTQGRELFVQAPTGIGKTLAMLYPSCIATGQGYSDKIFYLTAKTVTAVVAEEGMKRMSSRGLRFSFLRIIAKEKMCPEEEMHCDPVHCKYAKGHFDRVNEAVYDLICNENEADIETVKKYAEKHCVCPYEFALDISYYMDVIICDYNYVFDPHVYLRRYFAAEGKCEAFILIDEAHNLVDRAREMYSAVIEKEHLLAAKKLFPEQKRVLKQLDKCNKLMLQMKRESNGVTIYDIDAYPALIYNELTDLFELISAFLEDYDNIPERDKINDFFFEIYDYITAFEEMDEGYVAYSSFTEDEHFYLKLFCINPSGHLSKRFKQSSGNVLFSATLLPVNYYKRLLAGDKNKDAIAVDSPFDTQKRALLIGTDVSSKYTRRSYDEYKRIAGYLIAAVRGKAGNYLAFFPSHKFLEEVKTILETDCAAGPEELQIIAQNKNMNESERADFLREFSKERTGSLLGLSVMGGIFSEGIDLKNDSLIGVIVVGTGLPQVCEEREIIKNYYDKNGENGFDYAYRFPGFNKVLQAAGRLIRTTEDEGIILLLDERFSYRENRMLFPKEWNDCITVTINTVTRKIEDFWKGRENK